MKVKVTKDGFLIPKEVAERPGSDEVEVFEEPGRLLIVADTAASGDTVEGQDPILGLGSKPVHTGVRDGSTNHDRYLYDTGD